MKATPAIAAALLVLAGSIAACSGRKPIDPLTGPQNPAPPGEVTAAPPQTLLEPPPPEKKLVPLPTPTKRVIVCITERIGQAESAHRDPESEAILAEALLSVAPELNLEVVRKGTYEEILERDFEALVQKGLDENAQVFTNLLKAGVDFVALGEVGGSELSRDLGGGKTMSESFSLHAGIQMVRTDDARVIAAGNSDAAAKALRAAKTKALGDASRRLIEGLRAQPSPGAGPLAVTITVDGLSDFAQAERISRKLREVEGILWSRDLRFSAGSPGTASGVARYELAWAGSPELLRERIAALRPGVRLEVMRIEGNRWNYRAAGPAPEEPAPKTN